MKKRLKFSQINISTGRFVILILLFFLLIMGFIILLNKKIDLTSKIAVIPLEGTIGYYDSLTNQGINPDDIVSYIEDANKNKNIKAIILEIDSPGGTVVASEQIANAVSKSKKPVVAFIREIGASGAYWVASSSDRIIASRMSVTGSIGVTSSYIEFSKLMEKYGITYHSLKAGDYKEIGSPYTGLSKEEERVLQNTINKIYDYFIEQVSINRNISKSKVKEIATGMIYLGEEAKDIGLIDDIGDKEFAIKKAKELANITDAELVRYEKKETLLDVLSRISSRSFYFIGKGIGSVFVSADREIKFEV